MRMIRSEKEGEGIGILFFFFNSLFFVCFSVFGDFGGVCFDRCCLIFK